MTGEGNRQHHDVGGAGRADIIVAAHGLANRGRGLLRLRARAIR
jgi:hypothetical protein